MLIGRALAICIVVTAAVAQEGAPKPPEPPKLSARERQMRSVDRQRAAVEKQAQAVSQHFPSPWQGEPAVIAGGPPAPPPDCPQVTAAALKPIIDREAARQKVDGKLVQAVVEAESAYSPCAVSPVGAMGLMQLMPDTAQELGVRNPYDPDQNISAGTLYLKQMLDRYGGDIAKALAAYNAGPSRVDAAQGIPPIPETQAYVKKIMGRITPPTPVPE